MLTRVLFVVGVGFLLLALAGAAEISTRSFPRQSTEQLLPGSALAAPANAPAPILSQPSRTYSLTDSWSFPIILLGAVSFGVWILILIGRGWFQAYQPAGTSPMPLSPVLQLFQALLVIAISIFVTIGGIILIIFILFATRIIGMGQAAESPTPLPIQTTVSTSTESPTAQLIRSPTPVIPTTTTKPTEFVTPTDASSGSAPFIIVKATARVYLAPDTNSATVGRVVPDQEVEALGRTADNRWYYVSGSFGNGWVETHYLEPNPNIVSDIPIITPVGGETATAELTATVGDLPQSTPTPTATSTQAPALAQVRAEWPQHMEVGRRDQVVLELIIDPDNVTPSPTRLPNQSATSAPAATRVETLPRNALASPTPIAGAPPVAYEACVIANLVADGMAVYELTPQCQPLNQDRLVWEWEIVAQTPRDAIFVITLDIRWSPAGRGTPIHRTIWNGQLPTTISAYAIPTRQLAPLSLANVCIGTVMTAPVVYQRARGRRRKNPVSPTPAYLNTRFDGIGAEQPLPVGQRVPLIVWVGQQVTVSMAQSSRPFTFNFPDRTTPVDFIVHVHADPECWIIKAVEPILRVAPNGTTQQEAEFLITARKPGNDKLYISVQRVADQAMVQHIWLPVVAGEQERTAGEALRPTPTPPRAVRLPITSPALKRREIQLTIQSGRDAGCFEAVIEADLPHGRIHQFYQLPISIQEIQNATLRLRQELEKIVFFQAEEQGQTYYPFADMNDLTVDEALARQAVVPLADAGQQVWHLLFNGPRTPDGLKQMAAALRSLPHGSSLQVVIESQQFIVPWALLYDTPGPITAETLEWAGFWGYRLQLDVLPPGNYPDPTIGEQPSLQLLLSNDQELRRFTIAQEQYIQAELGVTQALVAWGTHDVLRSLSAGSTSNLLYLYCHGMHESATARPGSLVSESSLAFSPGEQVRLADLRRLRDNPFPGRPLVFLNACEGATQDAFYYDGFMPFFIEEHGARGFIGTEVKAPQLLAHDFAIHFMRLFAEGRPVGEILWLLRRHYIDTHHSILAFNYTLYGLDEVQLAKPLSK